MATHAEPGTLEGIKRFAKERKTVNDIPTDPHPSDEMRRLFNSSCFIPHPAKQRLASAIQSAATLNHTLGRPERRQLIALDGDYMAGKSTLLLEICADLLIEQPPRKIKRDGYRTITQPVALVRCTSDGQRGLMRATAAALEIPIRQTYTANEILDTVSRHLRMRDIGLLIFDDANLLKSAGNGEALTAFLKRALEILRPATLLFAGKGLHASPIGSGFKTYNAADQHASQQLARRTTRVIVENLELSDAVGIQRWLEAVDRACRTYLLKGDPASGISSEDMLWLHDLTEGRLGELYQLLGLAAADAVGGAERLSRQGLEDSHSMLHGDPLEGSTCAA